MMKRIAAPGPARGALTAQGLRPFVSWGFAVPVGFLLGKDLSVCRGRLRGLVLTPGCY